MATAGATPPVPVGVVLAGGRGRRIGGDKAIVELEGRPLVLYPLEALHEVCDDVAVVAKRDSLLPALAGVADLWVEPDEPRHPLAGVAHALHLAAGRSVLAVAVDLPFVTHGQQLGAIPAELRGDRGPNSSRALGFSRSVATTKVRSGRKGSSSNTRNSSAMQSASRTSCPGTATGVTLQPGDLVPTGDSLAVQEGEDRDSRRCR